MAEEEAAHLHKVLAQVTAKFRALQRKMRQHRTHASAAESGARPQRTPKPGRRGGRPFIPIQHMSFEDIPDPDPDLDTQYECVGMLQAAIASGTPVESVQRAMEQMEAYLRDHQEDAMMQQALQALF